MADKDSTMNDEKHGFRNCPEITEFKRGMEIVRNPYPARRIVSVDAVGVGLMDNAVYIHQNEMFEWGLKLNGLWEGQVRKGETGFLGTASSLSCDFSKVAFERSDSRQIILATNGFSRGYPTVVLPKPQPTLESVAQEFIDTLKIPWSWKDVTRRQLIDHLRSAGVTMPEDKNDD